MVFRERCAAGLSIDDDAPKITRRRNGDCQVKVARNEGSSKGIRLPGFDGEHEGSATPKRGPLDKVNEMFKAKGIDASPESVFVLITTFWGFFDANEEAAARNNTVVQLKASEVFSSTVSLAVLETVDESKEIQSYTRRHRRRRRGCHPLAAPIGLGSR